MSQEIVNKNEEEVVEETESTDTVDTEETTTDEGEQADEDLQGKVKELEEKNKKLENLIIKHKKDSRTTKTPSKTESDLSQNDLYALIKNNVHEDDISEVTEYAKLKNIPVKDALQSNIVKTILKDKEEFRKTASVTNTGVTRKTNHTVDADQLVANAREGKQPESKSDMEKVAMKILGIKE